MKESITLKITLKDGLTIQHGFVETIKRSRGIDSVEVLEWIKRK